MHLSKYTELQNEHKINLRTAKNGMMYKCYLQWARNKTMRAIAIAKGFCLPKMVFTDAIWYYESDDSGYKASNQTP